MKYCPYCGGKLDDDMAFCPACGKRFKVATESESVDNTQQKEMPDPAPTSHVETPAITAEKTIVKKRSFSRRKYWIGIAAIAIIVIAVIGVLLLRKPTGFSTNTRRIEQATESVVMITCYDNFGNIRCTGSGFILYDDQTVITNYHVIDRAIKANVSTDEDHTYLVESVLAYNAKKDIAILKVNKSMGLNPLTIGNSKDIQKGSTVVAIGSPLGNKNTVSTGILSGRWFDSQSNIDELQFSAPISNGSSGGALFNDSGEVIGVTSASLIYGQNLNLAIPIEEICSLYANRATESSFMDIFKQTYKTSSTYYLNSIFAEFHEIVDNPSQYDGKIITTVVFLAPSLTSSEEFWATETEDDMDSLYSGVNKPYITCTPKLSIDSLDKDYSGYIMISGTFEFTKGWWAKNLGGNLYRRLSGMETLALNNQSIEGYTYFSDELSMSIKYYE